MPAHQTTSGDFCSAVFASDVGANARSAAYVIDASADEHGNTPLTISGVAALMKVSYRTAQRALRELSDAGLVIRTHQNTGVTVGIHMTHLASTDRICRSQIWHPPDKSCIQTPDLTALNGGFSPRCASRASSESSSADERENSEFKTLTLSAPSEDSPPPRIPTHMASHLLRGEWAEFKRSFPKVTYPVKSQAAFADAAERITGREGWGFEADGYRAAGRFIVQRAQAYAASPSGQKGQYTAGSLGWLTGGCYDESDEVWNAAAARTPQQEIGDRNKRKAAQMLAEAVAKEAAQ